MSDEPQRPADSKPETWRAYWRAHGMPWRTEPEISVERQTYLTERRKVTPDIEHGFYPFRDEHGGIKLARADVEWLLATHESGGMRGPVDWSDVQQRTRDGLDLRGAVLRGEDLSRLPLARLRGGYLGPPSGGLVGNVDPNVYMEAGSIHLEGARLREVHLEDANLYQAHLEDAWLVSAYLNGAMLHKAHLDGANGWGADLSNAILSNTELRRTKLEEAHLEGVDLSGALFGGADLNSAFFDTATRLRLVHKGEDALVAARLVDVHWGGADLALVEWRPHADWKHKRGRIVPLGDERRAQRATYDDGKRKSRGMRCTQYESAVRASRQLAAVLRSQGLNEDADHFLYRAQCLRKCWLQHQIPEQWRRHEGDVWWRLEHVGTYLGSWFLAIIAGYGYRPGRSILAYLLLITSFAAAYIALSTPSGGHLQWYEALVVSLTAFHGRGFFAQQYAPGDPQSIIAAVEAVVGLLIEITFIATFTQRFFAR